MIPSLTQVLLLSASLNTITAQPTDYGSWYVTVEANFGAQGDRNQFTYVEHSHNPGVIGYWDYWYIWATNTTTYFTNDTSLNTTTIRNRGTIGLFQLPIKLPPVF